MSLQPDMTSKILLHLNCNKIHIYTYVLLLKIFKPLYATKQFNKYSLSEDVLKYAISRIFAGNLKNVIFMGSIFKDPELQKLSKKGSKKTAN